MRRNTVLARLTGIAAATAAIALLALPIRQAQALDTGAAVGIGLGSFALGTALGAAANPYYRPYYPYGYYPAPAYYPPPAPYYPPARSCWDPYSRNYYAC